MRKIPNNKWFQKSFITKHSFNIESKSDTPTKCLTTHRVLMQNAQKKYLMTNCLNTGKKSCLTDKTCTVKNSYRINSLMQQNVKKIYKIRKNIIKIQPISLKNEVVHLFACWREKRKRFWIFRIMPLLGIF